MGLVKGPGFDSQVQGPVVGAGRAVGAEDDGQISLAKHFQSERFPSEPSVAGGAVNHETSAGFQKIKMLSGEVVGVSDQGSGRKSAEAVGKGTGNPAIGQKRP